MNTIPKMLIVASTIALTAAPRAWSVPEAARQTQVQAATEIKTETIQLKHMPPSWLAEMLDPKSARDKAEADAKLGISADKHKSVFGLPEGVESITPDDGLGTLQVRGTAEGIARVRQFVEFLDLPLRKVEMEVQTVRFDRANLEHFGVNWAGAGQPMQLGFLRSDHKQALQKLLDANLASTLLDARATLANNIGSTLSSGAFDMEFPPDPRVTLQLTPTINNDNTITIVMDSAVKPAGVPDGVKVKTVANVRDGDTIVLTTPDIESNMVTLTFLTARIVRPADEKDAMK